jgi:hypothetical protein
MGKHYCKFSTYFTYNRYTFCARQNMVLLYLLSINRSDFSFANYLVRLEMASTRKTIEHKSLMHITQQRVLRLDDRVLVHHDSFKTNPTYNTDNKGKLFVTVFALAPAPKTNM